MNISIESINASQVQQKLAVPDQCQLVDVREPVEFKGGHIPGSISIPLSKLSTRASEICSDKPIYLICQTGRRAAQAAKLLLAAKLTNVKVLEGGMAAWQKQGNPVTAPESQIWSMDRQVRFTAGTLILIGIIFSYTLSPLWILLSGFVCLGMIFSAVTNSCGMAVLLAKMPWNS